MVDQTKLEALIGNLEGALTELKAAMDGEGEMPAEQPEGEMEAPEEMEPPVMGAAKTVSEDEEEMPPDIVRRMAGMR